MKATTEYLLESSHFNGDFTTSEVLGVFKHKLDAERCVDSLKRMRSRAFTEYHISTVRRYEEFDDESIS